MTQGLTIVAAGFHPTIQDLGRWGGQDLGIPVSGALDTLALRLANALVGNAENTGALELRLLGPSIEVTAESVRIALTGTEAHIEIQGHEARNVPAGRSVRLMRGQTFRIGAVRDTACAYLAVEGGFDLPAPYGSQSTYIRSAIGGFEGRALKDGDRLGLNKTNVALDEDRLIGDAGNFYGDGPIRIVFGPQRDYFEDKAVKTLVTSQYTITKEADRMGVRLDGPALDHKKGFNIASDGIANGAIQVPGTKLPIVLLADHQTTGGYPKIATVISADLPRLGRLKPGATLRFQAIDVAEAEQVRRTQEAAFRHVIDAIRPIYDSAELNETALYHVNLISGAVRISGLR